MKLLHFFVYRLLALIEIVTGICGFFGYWPNWNMVLLVWHSEMRANYENSKRLN